jgi:hypothetical protein
MDNPSAYITVSSKTTVWGPLFSSLPDSRERKCLFVDCSTVYLVCTVKERVEEQLKTLLAKHTLPPPELIIPILEKAGWGEQELGEQLYGTTVSLANGIRRILNLRDKNMKTLAKIFEVIMVFSGQKFELIELSATRFSLSISDCPMLHVGKNMSTTIKSKFCDLYCNSGSKAIADTVLGLEPTCSWDKSLVRGTGKCTLTFESRKSK